MPAAPWPTSCSRSSGGAAVISEISQAPQEQASGLDLVSGAVQRIDEVTQQNAALVEQGAAATSSLQDQTVRPNEAVGVFRVEAVA